MNMTINNIKFKLLKKNKLIKSILNNINKITKKYEITKPFNPSIKFVPLIKIIKQNEVNKQLIQKFCK